MVRLMQSATKELGKTKYLITDHGTQFLSRFHAATVNSNIRLFKGRVRTVYVKGKLERAFRRFRLWWRLVLCGLSQRSIQRRVDRYRHWYNHHRPPAALKESRPNEAWNETSFFEPIPIPQRDAIKPSIKLRCAKCRGDPSLPVIQITLINKAA